MNKREGGSKYFMCLVGYVVIGGKVGQQLAGGFMVLGTGNRVKHTGYEYHSQAVVIIRS